MDLILDKARELGIAEDPHAFGQESSSALLVDTLSQLSMLQEQLDSLQLQHLEFYQGNETHDLTQSGALEDKLATAQTITTSLRQVLEGKETIIAYLEQPVVGSSVLVELEHQQDLKELLKNSSTELSALQDRLDVIKYAEDLTMTELGQLESVPLLLAKFQRYLDALQHMREKTGLIASNNGVVDAQSEGDGLD